MKLAPLVLLLVAKASGAYVFTVWHDASGSVADTCAAPATNAGTIVAETDGTCVKVPAAVAALANPLLTGSGDVWLGWSGSNYNIAITQNDCEAGFNFAFIVDTCNTFLGSSAGPNGDQAAYLYAAALTCPDIASYDLLGTSINTPILKSEYCGTTFCQTALGDKIKNKYKTATTFDMNPSTLGADTVDCTCNAANNIADADAYISTGGVFVIGSAAGKAKVCASASCKAATLDADYGTTSNGAAIYHTCLPAEHDCDAAGAGGQAAMKAKLTECMCEAAAADYNFWLGKDVGPSGDNTWQTFCGFTACAEANDQWVAAGISSTTCAAAQAASTGALIGGIAGGVGGALLVGGYAYKAMMNAKNAAPKGGAASASAATV